MVRLNHSSINRGAPVLVAGEMEIKEGKLISINPYSGHYQPSLYSIAIFLRYLSSRGLDVSKTKVFLINKPQARLGLEAKKVNLEDNNRWWYQISAQNVTTLDQLMKQNIQSAENYRTSNLTMIYSFFSKVTSKKINLANQFGEEIGHHLEKMRSVMNSDITLSLEGLEKIIERYINENKKIPI